MALDHGHITESDAERLDPAKDMMLFLGEVGGPACGECYGVRA